MNPIKSIKSTKLNKYSIEGDINFFDELDKLVKNNNANDSEKCLITDEPLSDLSVQLSCGHSFNYIPLYKEVCNQKNSKNFLEISKPSFHEMKCPYCRKIQKTLLPFHESLESICPKVYGVNSLITNIKPTKESKPQVALAQVLCPQLLKTGANKGTPCGKCVHANTAGLCTRHYNLSLKLVNPIPPSL
jgi:hypothetical protein